MFFLFKQTFRNLARHKLTSLVNILGLSVSISLIILLSVFLETEKSVDAFHANSNRIYRVLHSNECSFSPPFGQYIQDNLEGIESWCRTFDIEATLKTDITLQKSKSCFFADSGFFEMFSFPLIQGNSAQVLKDKNSVVLSQTGAQKLFGDEDPIGKIIRYNNRLDFVVTGIAADFTENTHFKAVDAIFPFHALNDVWGSNDYLTQFNWRYFIPALYVLADKNHDLSGKGTELYNKVKSWYWLFQDGRNKDITFQPLKQAYLNPAAYGYPFGARQGNNKQISLVLLIVIGITVIAVINFINLQLAQSVDRIKEVGIKKLSGAKRIGIIGQSLFETGFISVISVIFALGLTSLILPAFNQLVTYQVTFSQILTQINVYQNLAITLIVLQIAGLAPALILSNFTPLSITDKKVGRFKTSLVQKSMVILQYSISISLIIALIAIKKQNHFMLNYNLGLNKDKVLYVVMNSDFKTNKQAFKDELKKLPGVDQVSYCSGFPGVGIMPLLAEHQNKALNLDWLMIDNSYFNVFGVSIDQDSLLNGNSCYLSQSAARKLENIKEGDSFEVNMSGQKATLIVQKILPDINFHSLYEPVKPTLYTLRNPGSWVDYALIKVNTTDYLSFTNNLKKLYQRFSQHFPFEMALVNDTLNKAYEKDLKTSEIVGWFSLFGIIISSLGIFSLSVLAARKRIKEIGIRKVNGAHVFEIIRLLNIDFIKWVVLAFTLTCPAAYLLVRNWLGNFAYKTAISWWIFVLAGIITLFIALITVSWQTIKAALQNPVDALRYE